MDMVEMERSTFLPDRPKTIWITQDIGETKYRLRVRKYILQQGDQTLRSWKSNGQLKYYNCSQYAIEDMEATGNDLSKFVDDNMQAFIEHFVNKGDDLMWKTYHTALKYTTTAEVSYPSDKG